MKCLPWIIVAAAAAGCGAGSTSTSSQMLSCAPESLTPQSTLTLTFGADHPAELAIQGPDGTDFFLVYWPDASMAPAQRPIMDKQSFTKINTLALPTATAKGTPWVAGREENELIFRKPGAYEVTLADALESDASPRVFSCTVHFTP